MKTEMLIGKSKRIFLAILLLKMNTIEQLEKLEKITLTELKCWMKTSG